MAVTADLPCHGHRRFRPPLRHDCPLYILSRHRAVQQQGIYDGIATKVEVDLRGLLRRRSWIC